MPFLNGINSIFTSPKIILQVQ